MLSGSEYIYINSQCNVYWTSSSFPHCFFPRGLGVKTTFTAGTYKPVVVVTIIEGSHPAVVAR